MQHADLVNHLYHLGISRRRAYLPDHGFAAADVLVAAAVVVAVVAAVVAAVAAGVVAAAVPADAGAAAGAATTADLAL